MKFAARTRSPATDEMKTTSPWPCDFIVSVRGSAIETTPV